MGIKDGMTKNKTNQGEETALYALYGIHEDVYQEKIGEDFKTDYQRELVATFSSIEKARSYVEKRKLRRPISVSFGGDRVFRKGSGLEHYSSYEVEEYYPDDVPHDPE